MLQLDLTVHFSKYYHLGFGNKIYLTLYKQVSHYSVT